MKKERSVKQRLISAILVLVMLFTSLLGTTFAWFTDSVTSAGNTIQSGSLKVDLSHKAENGEWVSLKQHPDHSIFDYDKWEPGYTRVEQLKVDNLGSLALQYRLSIEVATDTADLTPDGKTLADVIDVYLFKGESQAEKFADITGDSNWTAVGTLAEVMADPSKFISGKILPTGKTSEDDTVSIGSETYSIALHMQESAGNEYQSLNAGDIFVNLIATQWTFENDAFGNDYDDKAEFPEIDIDDLAIEVEVEGGLVKATKSASRAGVSITIPAGVMVDGVMDGTATLVLSVDEKAESEANVKLEAGEVLHPLDVHVEGVADDNTVPMIITIEKAMPVGLNMGNYTLYHVENGVANPMTSVENAQNHNEFYYDPATGNTTLGLATFSEVAVVADTENAWKGNFDYSWYTNAVAPADGDGEPDYVIANADQLAAFGAIVGGMDGQTQDSFKGKTVKLIADVNIGDLDSENGIVFYPIGYNSDDGKYEKTGVAVSTGFYSFMGTFDGNGHTVSNFYQNTWEMKGDHDWYSPEEQYYRDGMGLFGKVYGGTVKNLTVKNFSSDGEITTTGVIAAYADGATFENIAIFDCNPRVYNIGNGGIVGCVGWYAKEADLKTTFTNITVDNSNKISALWGSYDVACGGIVGQYYPTSGQSSAGKPANAGVHFENCHVSAVMDVYNDVCANYQYYAYRYTGMLIGSVRENETIDGHVYPKMNGITASECTVHFGTWNDYYYCEIIDNTTASYTHDYQMSRLTEIKAINGTTITYLDGTTGTVPASGRANYVIVDYEKGHGTDNATCYHFKDGAVWTHDMGGIQTGIDENGDGLDDLKEDKQHIYLEFNNLVTGYGWGVTSKGVGDLAGVTILDREVGDSKVKFEKVDTAKDRYMNGKEITIGDIFKAATLEDAKLSILNPSVSVTVSPVGDDSTVSAEFEPNTSDWTKGTLTFSGTGTATITITDYYFCTPTTITVNVIERESEVKFENKFTGDFLYRVGNQNAVKLDSLFKAKDGANIGTVSVTVEAVNGTAASGAYTSNATWTNGTIQFSGTGVVKVTITDNDYCIPTELYLEVVDAVNATTATNATANNVVLLNDCGFSSLEVSGGYALYGNGFTMTCGSDSYAVDRSYGFVTLTNGTLDNVQIVAPNFSHSILYDSNKKENGNPSYSNADGTRTWYYNIRSAVVMSGNSKITNSFISGGRAAVYAMTGNPVIENSTIVGGAAANIHVETNNNLLLKDVTLIQKPIHANVNDTTKTVMGLSVVLICDSNGVGAPITLSGTLRQYAWAHEGYKEYVPSDGQELVGEALNQADYVHEITYEDGVTRDSVNMGFVYMPQTALSTSSSGNMSDKREETDSVPYGTATVNGDRVAIYTYKNSNGTHEGVKTEPNYVPNQQKAVLPSIKYVGSAENCIFTTEYRETDGWTATLKVDVDAGAYSFSFVKLLAQKYGENLSYTVKTEDGTVVDKNAVITLNSTVSKVYILTITDNQIYDENGNLTDETAESTYIFELLATKTSLPAPTWTSKALNGTPYIVVDSKGGDWNCAVPVLDGLKVKYWSKKQNKEIELDLANVVSAADLSAGLQNGSNNTLTITVADEYTLTVTTTGFKTNDNGKPVVVNNKLYFTVSSSSNYVSTNTTDRTVSIGYSFTDANNSDPITLSTSMTVTYADYSSNQYKYSDFCNGTLTAASGGCVTPDTLVTLADGTQKRVDELSFGDKILAWDFFTGTYVEREISLLVNHGEALYSIANLQFSDGTTLKLIADHGVFDYDLNKFVYLTVDNMQEYIGHRFVQYAADGSYNVVTLTNAYATEEYTSAWSITSAGTSNAFASGMLTVAPPEDFYNWIEMSDKLTYDAEQFQHDVETYGLYTYDDFKDYVTYEQFVDWNGAYLKIAVEKGYFTFEYILELIELYKGWMP